MHNGSMKRALAYLLLPALVATAMAQSKLIPTPKSVKLLTSRSPRPRLNGAGGAMPEFQRVYMAFLASSGQRVQIGFNKNLGDEEYRINTQNGLNVEASTPTGLAWGLQTLSQLLDSDPNRKVEIQDEPDLPFRCVMIDVARRFYSLSTLRVLTRWCQLGKVRYMQLHLTDDQNWMFPTDLLPGVDKRNNSRHPAYTRKELGDLQDYASARGVTIIPEIDIPGHSSLLTALDPETFKLKGSPSNSFINFGSPKVREKVKALLKEVAELFPNSPYIHIGCDEVWYQDAEMDPDVAAEMKRLNAGAAEVFVDFVAEMANTVLALKKTPLIWEGFPASTFAKDHIPKAAGIVAWDGNSYPASKLIPDGFNVVNAGMDPFYIINHYPYDLNTMAPLQRLYRADSMQFASMNGAQPFRFQDKSKVLGSMLCWWEGHEWTAREILPQRILAFGARLWNADKERNFESFQERASLASEKRWNRMFAVFPQLSDSVRSYPNLFETATELMVEHPKGTSINISLDGVPIESIPRITDYHVFEIGLSRDGKTIGETMFFPAKKVTIIPSLALNCPVTVSGDDDPQFPASRVTNGVNGDLTNYWIAYPNPQFLRIDLRKAQSIGRIEVVCYWATGDPTKYRISVSEDGKSWKEVVDASKQIAPSLESGYVHTFNPMQARFVRLETLGGNLYPSNMTRINQIRVFEK